MGCVFEGTYPFFFVLPLIRCLADVHVLLSVAQHAADKSTEFARRGKDRHARVLPTRHPAVVGAESASTVLQRACGIAQNLRRTCALLPLGFVLQHFPATDRPVRRQTHMLPKSSFLRKFPHPRPESVKKDSNGFDSKPTIVVRST